MVTTLFKENLAIAEPLGESRAVVALMR